jgi:hypothetical protein
VRSGHRNEDRVAHRHDAGSSVVEAASQKATPAERLWRQHKLEGNACLARCAPSRVLFGLLVGLRVSDEERPNVAAARQRPMQAHR